VSTHLLLDANLSPELKQLLADVFPSIEHVNDAHLLLKTDTDIWNYALTADCVIVTKDSDFRNRAKLATKTPKIVWMTVGNCSTERAERILRLNAEAIQNLIKGEQPRLLVLL
jgi:predicted nuclease of predicted toxin-antitoxin system